MRDQADGTMRYDCYFPDRPFNEKKYAKSFDHIEAAAKFLIDNNGTGIRINPGTAIINVNIVIARDEPEGTME
ncbi:hypothetical protein OAE29_01590 [Octadecabacter sp.]|nr:hypothetical protein [Octadecabacter sp.]